MPDEKRARSLDIRSIAKSTFMLSKLQGRDIGYIWEHNTSPEIRAEVSFEEIKKEIEKDFEKKGPDQGKGPDGAG